MAAESKYRIMVVDDDPDIRFVTTRLLDGDFETVEAENGLDALEKIDRYEPDLMLVDIGMPVMDGFATCESIRRHDEFHGMPVFFVTAHASDQALERARAAGCHAYIEKPFDTNALIGKIRQFFSEHAQPPRGKMFSVEDLAKIDSTPLRAAEDDLQTAKPEDIAAAEHQPAGPFADTNAPGISGPSAPAPESPEADEGRGGIRLKRKRVTLGSVVKKDAAPEETPKAEAAKPPEPEKPAGPRIEKTTAIDVNQVLDRLKGLQKKDEPPSQPAAKTPSAPEPAQVQPPRLPVPAEPPSRPTRMVPRPSAADFLVPPPDEPAPPPKKAEAPKPAPPPLPPPSAKRPVAPVPPLAPQPPTRPAPPLRHPTPPPVRATPPAAPKQPAPKPAPMRPAAPAPAPAPATASAPAPARPKRPIPEAAKAAAAGEGAAKPRVLCLIDSRAELNEYLTAIKGVGEFLPLQDPVEAIEIVARFQPDVVAMHIVSEKYSGLQIAQLLQSNPRLSHIEVIFLFTGRESPPQLKAAERLSANKHLRAPATSAVLREALQKVMAKPGFAVRAKKLGYGAYVDEVLKKERGRDEEQRKEREKRFYEEKHGDLIAGLKEVMQEFKPRPEDLEMEKKNLQSYYLT